jgi:CRP-like cAMP-binding protein
MTSEGGELLDGLTAEQAGAVKGLGSMLTLAAGESLFRLGSEADRLFVVERGRIALSLPMRVGQQEEEVLVEERAPGQAVGWSALVPPHRFTLTATAQVDTQVLALPRAALLAHFADRPDVGYAVTRNVAAVTGQRLQVFQAMWLREMQRMVRMRYA